MARPRSAPIEYPLVERWGIYQISDENVLYYPRGARTPHLSRYFLVLSPHSVCSNRNFPHVLGVPLTTQKTRAVPPWDIEIPGSMCGTTRDKCWLQVTQMQPMEKQYLVGGPGGRAGELAVTHQEELLGSWRTGPSIPAPERRRLQR